jgi:hypothetical protein
MDLRFGTPEQPRFVMSTLLGANLAPLHTTFSYGRPRN